MILLTWRLMPAEDASSLESGDLGITVLFHQSHFVWEQESLRS